MSNWRGWCSENAISSGRLHNFLTKLAKTISLTNEPKDFIIRRMVANEVRLLSTTLVRFVLSFSQPGILLHRSKEFPSMPDVRRLGLSGEILTNDAQFLQRWGLSSLLGWDGVAESLK